MTRLAPSCRALVVAVVAALLVGAVPAAPPALAADDPATPGRANVEPSVFPTPQELVLSDVRGSVLPLRATVRAAADVPDGTVEEVVGVLEQAGVRRVEVTAAHRAPRRGQLDVWVGQPATSAPVAAALDAAGVAPVDQPEGYALAVTGDRGRAGVVLAGADADGTYYAVQTLRQLLGDGAGRARLPAVEVRDWPEMALRGTIEGFYGSPWTHAERLDQLDFYGDVKMNTYVYAPKDDPYHRERWREPYPPEKLAELAELVEVADANHVDFTFALSPGVSICYSDPADVDALLAKLAEMYDIGVRAFSIPLDDISYTRWNCTEDAETYGPAGQAAAGRAQADLLNTVQREFIETSEGARPLQMVPTEYGDVNETPYKEVLRTELDDDVVVMWTGTAVVPPAIDVADAQAFADVYGRPPFLWDNYPVNDFAQTAGRLLLAPYQKREAGLSDVLVGIVSNPMNQAAASKIALFTIADFTWNDDAYDHERSWRGAMAYLADGDDEVAAALLAFADLNHLAPTFGTDPWLPQAPLLSAALDGFWDAYAGDDPAAAVAAVRPRFQAIADAPATIRAGVDDELFLSDVSPWLDATAWWGQALVASADLLDALAADDGAAAWRLRGEIAAAVAAAEEIRSTPGENRVEGQVQIGDGVVDAFVDEVLDVHDRWLGVSAPSNLALGAEATQSSEYEDGAYPAGNAVNGNLTDFSHTDFTDQPWWQVDLGDVALVDHVNVWGRTGCCADRVSDYHLLVSEEPIDAASLDEALADPDVVSVHVEPTAGRPSRVEIGTTGRYVRLWLTGSTALNMAELEVMGRPPGTGLLVSGGPPAADGSSLADAADGDVASAYTAARAPAGGEALVVEAPDAQPLRRVIVLADPDRPARADVEARVAGGWETIGTVDGAYAEIVVDGIVADAVRLRWHDGAPAPAVAEVIAWFDGPDAGPALSWESAPASVEGGTAATASLRVEPGRTTGRTGSLSVVVTGPDGSAATGVTATPATSALALRRGVPLPVDVEVVADPDAAPGSYTVTATAAGDDWTAVAATAVVTVALPTTDENVALGGTATASSVEVPQFPPGAAVDGDLDTRWASLYTDDEWWQVELAEPVHVGRVVLHWEAAHATAYELQTSSDGSTWTTAAAVADGDGGTDVLSVDAPDARFVRVQGVERSSDWGYSLYEVEVYPVAG